MLQKKYEHVFFIGRFQPMHNGHVSVIKHANKISNNVHILVGSSNVARSVRNPFTFLERSTIIKNHFKDTIKSVSPIKDHPYNDTKWITEVLSAINKLTINENGKSYTVKINTNLDINIINRVADAYILQAGNRYFKSWVKCIMDGKYTIEIAE